jgi:DNA-binding CsgD family transcriptional regulator
LKDRSSVPALRRPIRSLAPALLHHILDDIRDAVMLVGDGGRLLYANSAAEALLARDGPLKVRQGRLRSRAGASDTALRRAIDSACAGEPPATQAIVMDHPDQVPLVVVVKCPPDSEFADATSPGRALLLTFDPHPDGKRLVGPLRECFGLTKSEAEVAAAIAEGSSVARIAERRRVAVNTIRSQIKIIAAKFGCTRQSQIAAIVNAVPLAPEVGRP